MRPKLGIHTINKRQGVDEEGEEEKLIFRSMKVMKEDRCRHGNHTKANRPVLLVREADGGSELGRGIVILEREIGMCQVL